MGQNRTSRRPRPDPEAKAICLGCRRMVGLDHVCQAEWADQRRDRSARAVQVRSALRYLDDIERLAQIALLRDVLDGVERQRQRLVDWITGGRGGPPGATG